MTFSVDDYEKAIARIFDKQKNVIGTGFLVAPGYILTCAHVVLQAIGIAREKFAEYQEKPEEPISLDFPILASGQPIQAKVIDWFPYNLESGDIAALKLLAPEPEGARAIPLVVVSAIEVEKDEHFVYGFGNNLGGRSDAYRPKTTVAGARFQLCKFGDQNDETIQAGFSGAPVWNQVRQCVIGMVATAVVPKDEQKSKAYAIPTKELRSVLQKVSALRLHDVLMQSLNGCGSDEEKYRLKIAVNAALQRCNPNGADRSWQDQLVDLSVDRAPAPGWVVEGRLVQFAMILAWMEDTPLHTLDHLKIWVECHNLKFSDLLERITREMRQRKVSSSNVCEHLMVVVERVETSNSKVRVSMWAIANLETYDAKSPPLPLVQEENISLEELPAFIQKQHRSKFGKEIVPIIHLFVPRDLLCCDVEMRPFGKLKDVLGSTYPFVIRTNLAVHPISEWYHQDWNKKWEQIEQSLDEPTLEVFDDVDCQVLSEPDSDQLPDFIDGLEHQNAVILRNCTAFEELFELLAGEKDSALPIALWSRDSQFEEGLTNLLDGLLRNFPARIQQEREGAKRSRNEVLIGQHLSLVWENPKIVPPDMQFDPEAC